MSRLSDDAMSALPETPEPVEVEIEFTNICNARCSACPRADMPEMGYLRRETLDRILERYLAVRAQYKLNRLLGSTLTPRIAVAGGGEPLLHRQASEFLRHIVARGFQCHLITNGSRLSDQVIDHVLAAGLHGVSVSFWGIRPEEYERSMRLPYHETLRKVERFANAAREAGLPLRIVWVRTPQITSTNDEIATFWKQRGVDVDLSDTSMWNRGGLVTLRTPRDAALMRPDLRRNPWCADLFFSDTYDWQGRILLCCCNYFSSASQVLGSVETHSPLDVARVKARILTGRPIPAMCQVCEQPRRQQSQWMAEPWLRFLSEADLAMLTYDPGWAPAPATR